FAAHEEQPDNVAKVYAAGIVIPFKPLEAIEQHLIVNLRPVLVRGGDAPGPEAEGAFRRALPRFAAIIPAMEFAAQVEQNAEVFLAGLELPTADGAAPGVGFDLVFRHACSPSAML